MRKVSTTGEIIPLARLEAADGPFFGEAGILGSPIRSASVFADSECSCLILAKNNFEKFTEEYPRAALKIYRRLYVTLFERMHRADDSFYFSCLERLNVKPDVTE